MHLRQLPGGSRARRGFLALIMGTGTGNLLTLALAPIITRLFDPASFGSFTLLLSVALVLTSVMSLRLELAVPLARDDVTSYAVVQAGLACALILSAMGSPLLYVVGPEIGAVLGYRAAGRWLWVTPLMASAMSVYLLLNALAIRQGRYRTMAMRNVIMVGAGLGLQILAGLLGYGVGGLVVGYACGQMLGAAALLVGSGMSSGTAKSGRSTTALREAMSRYRRVPLLLAPAGVVNALGLQVPVVLLAFYYTSDVVGWFGLTQRVLAAPVTLIGLSVAQVYLGEAARARREEVGHPSAYFWKVSRVLALLGAVAAVALLVGGPPAFELLFGSQWRTSGDFARALAIALAAQLIASPLSQTLIIFERSGLQLAWDTLRVLCVTGSLMTAGMLKLPAEAAVWALGVALVATYALSWEMSRRTIACHLRQSTAGQQAK